MDPEDEFARLNLTEFRRAIENGETYTLPWLNLDTEAYRAYREKRSANLPAPLCNDPRDVMMMEHVQGMNVLCLAGGGGQQSAVYSLLGASVTVLDLVPEQLKADQAAARHYGYTVRTIQGDMRDLSGLADNAFDRVYQPISTLYVPDLRPVYAGVQRVLKPGGLYTADYTYPLLYMAHVTGWDGAAYTLRVSEPYQRGLIRETPDGVASFTRGEIIGEFHHLLSDILNGLIAEGLRIRAVWENPRPDSDPAVETLEPGSEEHRNRFLPFGLSVVAEKPLLG